MPVSPPLPVIMCADDFGLSPGVDAAIIELVEKGRLTAVSCMSLGPSWTQNAAALRNIARDGVAVGLHLTFTYLPPLTSFGGLERHDTEKALLLKAVTGRLDKKLVYDEMKAQFEQFIAQWGRAPDYIDGHQHVHTLPIIRDAMLALRQTHAPHSWVRNTTDMGAMMESRKGMIVGVMGWSLLRMLRRLRIPHNKYIRGFYDYAVPHQFAAQMDIWTRLSTQQAPLLIYCHPGHPDQILSSYDNLIGPRRDEAAYLAGDVFGAKLDTHIRLTAKIDGHS